MRLNQAPAPMFTDAAGNYEKARALTPCEYRGQRAVVNVSNKPTGVSADNTRAGLTPTRPRERTQLKLATLLSPRSLGKSRCEADNERSSFRETGPSNLRSH